ncbi:MAG: hypothetical protein IJH65_04220 [Methanobrevibacter sp.]|nr:hypothetical protein [Methanobrevibacter sp.]
MAIKIDNYKLSSGVTLREAYILVTGVNFSTKEGMLAFWANVYTNDDITSADNTILEQGTIHGNISGFDYTDQNLIEEAEGLIEDKIDAVRGKTQEECDEHNMNLEPGATWLDIWDYKYTKYISGEPSEDDDYIEAGKILLGVE